ncbi:MAG TPA: alpha/beta hydrolase [Galbitalea sp.]|jgi:acetyl esterase/lipase|nr:alpha/beta hydrolase [Galbitalea sp.]
MTELHPDLVGVRRIPTIPYNRVSVKVLSALKIKGMTSNDEVSISSLTVSGPAGAPNIALRVFQPRGLKAPGPALFWIHGGGMVIGAAEQDDRTNVAFAKELGITVVAARYRLAPGHPFPAPLDDVYAGLLGLFAHAAELGIDPKRVAIGGASAGGGLAAGLALLAHDRGEVAPMFQLLVYPMIDDRTLAEPDSKRFVWTTKANRFGWTSYLGDGVGGPDVSPYAAPARREDLSGLPPTWIGVGDLDLFYEEDLEYSRHLKAAGVACEFTTIPGAFHGFNALFPDAPVTQDFWRQQADALRGAFS